MFEQSPSIVPDSFPGANGSKSLPVDNIASPQPLNTSLHTLAIIDAGVENIDTLMADIQADAVVVLDANQNGIEQITQILTQYNNIDSLQIISHGNQSQIQLGNTVLDSITLTEYSDHLAQWGTALTAEADMLFYGCNIGAGEDGLAFVNQLSQLTGADIAASDDLTGHWGDWNLEVNIGTIESDLAISSAAQAAFNVTLALVQNSSFESGLNGWIGFTGTEAVSSSQANTGSQSLQLSSAGSGASQALDVTAGETYSFSGFARTTSTSFSSVGLNFFDSDWNYLDGTSQQVTGNSWQAYTFTDAAPTNARYATVTAYKETSDGNTFFDDLQVDFDGTPPPPPPPGSELLQNAGFESDLQDWVTFLGSEAIVSSNVFEGSKALSLSQAGSGASQVVEVDVGETYSLSGYARSTGSDYTSLGLNFFDENFNYLGGDSAQVTGSTWQEYTLQDVAPTGSRFATVVAYKDGNGGALFADGLSLTTGSTPPPDVTFALQNSNTIFVNEAAGTATVTAIRTGDTQSQVTLEYTTNEIGGADSAQANADYTTPTFNGRPNTGQIVFNAGETEKSFTIPILNDTAFEGNETFAVGLQNPSTGTLGAPRTTLITIVDDDTPATLAFSSAAVTVSESDNTATVTVQRSGDVSGTASVSFNTSNGTATAGSDYDADSGVLSFAAGQTTQTINIALLDDAVVEGNENFAVTLSNPSGAVLGTQATSTITILDNDLELGDLTRTTAVSGLVQPTTLDWTSDGRYMLVAQKNGIVRVVDNGVLRSTPLVDLTSRVNDTRDRGLLGLAIHPNFPETPYLYVLYTHDPAETIGRTGLGGPDGNGNRPSQLARVTVNPNTMVADPNSLVVLAGKNSTWEYTSNPTSNSTGNTNIRPSGIVGPTVPATAPIDVGTQDNDPGRAGIQNQNIRDYLATDSESHSIGDLEFGSDGYLYLSNGDGTSYNFVDPRTVRVQDINNLSGKILRIDPITGEGVASNPFYNGNGDSNASKVFYSGVRNPFRVAMDPVTNRPVFGDVGWNSFEEINTGAPGSNFGWPYLEGPNRTGGYQNLDQAISFYNNGNRNNPGDAAAVFPILPRTHGAPDNANAIMVGDFYNSNTLMFGDVNGGTLYAATLNNSRQVTNVQVFDSGLSFVVDMKMGPDGRLYGVNLVSGQILRWEPAGSTPDEFTYNGNRYRLTNGLKSWEQAQAEAQSFGGNLVTINNSAEENWIKQTFSSSERLWIGLTDQAQEGNFQWANGETSTYRNWAPGEPNDYKFDGTFPAGEDYTVMNWNSASQWNDMPNDFAGTFRGIIEID